MKARFYVCIDGDVPAGERFLARLIDSSVALSFQADSLAAVQAKVDDHLAKRPRPAPRGKPRTTPAS